jgi:hypothetical protein
MKLKLLLILLIFGVISTLSLATTEPTVTEDDDRDDTQPESEEKDLEALKTKEVDSKDKLTLAEIKLKEANKPFVPSQRLIEAQENTTKATEVLDATHEKVDETNATVEENKKEFEIIRKTFDKSKKRDTMLRKKMNQLKSQLLFATAKEMEVMEAHNKTREHIEQHRIGDAKKQYAKAVKQDTMKVDNLKAREAADKSTLKELLLSIKKRLHGDDPHTQRLLQTVSDATRTIHEAATGSKKYIEAKNIMKLTLHQLYKLNGKGADLAEMKASAKSLGKDIRNLRKEITKSEEKAADDAAILKEIGVTNKIPSNVTIQISDGHETYEKKRLIIQEVALAMNVTSLKKDYEATAKAYRKEHNTTFKKAKELFTETQTALNNTVAELIQLLANLTVAEVQYKQDKRKSDTMTVAQKAMRAFDIEYAKEDVQAAKFKHTEIKAQLKRAKEVLKVLKQASADADNVGTQVDAIKQKTEVKQSDIEIPKFNRMDPESIEDAEEKKLENISPVHVELARLAKHLMWGANPESYMAEGERLRSMLKERKEAGNTTKTVKVDASISKALLKNSKGLKFKAISNGLASGMPLDVVPKNHCFDGKQNFGEQGVDCGGSCARRCGFHHVLNIRGATKDPYHKVSMIPNQELLNPGESEKPMMVKSLKELLVGNADVGGHPNMEPVMNDGKVQQLTHVENSRHNNKDEKIRNWDHNNRFKSSRRNHLRRARKAKHLHRHTHHRAQHRHVKNHHMKHDNQ